jgi:hypothetical protein
VCARVGTGLRRRGETGYARHRRPLLLGAPSRRLAVTTVLSAMVFLLGLQGAAHADLFAITEVGTPNGGIDLARFAVGSGASESLPSGVNTNSDDLHPALSPDGTKLAYWSNGGATGTTRIVVVNLATGTSADLLNAFDALTIQPDDPSWIDDGHVAIGRAHQMAGGSFLAHATPIDVTSFPNGPFARGNNDFMLGTFPANGRTLDFERRLVPAPNAIVTVAGVRATVSGVGQVVLEGESAHLGVGNSGGNTASYDHPTVSPSAGVIVMQHGGITNNNLRLQELIFTDLNLQHPTALPNIIDEFSSSETRPEFSVDGRYLGFVRQVKTSNPRLFVWDIDTQLLVNPVGIDLGPLPFDAAAQALLLTDGNVAIGSQPLILNSSIFANGLISFNLAALSNIGIIVQKVIGHTRVLGRPGPRLRFLGRVPLGQFRRGHGVIRWSRRVNGKRLPRGRYQITLRSVTKSGSVRDLGRPVLVRISAPPLHHPAH